MLYPFHRVLSARNFRLVAMFIFVVGLAQVSTRNAAAANTRPPGTPTATTVANQVYLSWQPSPSAVVGYRVYRATESGGPYQNQNSTIAPVPALNFTDTAVAAGATYYYVVTAVDASGVESIYSNEVVAIVPNASSSQTTPIGLVAGLNLNGSAQFDGNSLSLTTAKNYLAGSAWYPAPVNVQAFSSDFTFQLAGPTNTCMGDGFAFVIQNAGPTALGSSGGGLGYGPDDTTNPSSSSNPSLLKSVAIKFDLYDNAGEGTNSTGLYINGASPTVPAAALGNGVSLQSGDPFRVHLNYDGTNLTTTITDTVNPAKTYVLSTLVNIPATVGANTAYVGFTGATGACVSSQNILSWNYNPSPTPDLVNSVLPTSQTISLSSGESAVYSVSLQSLGSLNSNIALSVTGVPTGAIATFSPTVTITGGSGASTLTIMPAPTTTPGTYIIGITGTGGSVAHTANVILTLNP